MHMVKRLMQCIREYKLPSLLSPLFITGEVVIECFIPFITAQPIDSIEAGRGMDVITQYGFKLVILAICSLMCGALAGHFCAVASCGFAKISVSIFSMRFRTIHFQTLTNFRHQASLQDSRPM